MPRGSRQSGVGSWRTLPGVFRALVGAVALAGALAPAAEGASPEAAEILYAEARVLANAKDYAGALARAEAALREDPDSAEAVGLVAEMSRKLGRDAQAQAAATRAARLRRRRDLADEAAAQLEFARSDIEAELWDDAIRRMQWIVRQPELAQGASAAVYSEAQFDLGVSLARRSADLEAVRALAAVPGDFRQRSLLLAGDLWLKHGYATDALRAYSAASGIAAGARPELTQQAGEFARKLSSVGIELQGSAMVGGDSNPFGLPDGQSTADGTPDSAAVAALAAAVSLRSAVRSDSPWVYRLNAGAGQSYALERDGRQTLDAESVGVGPSATGSAAGVGHLSLQYWFQYVQSPEAAASGGYSYGAVSDTHTLGAALSHEIGARLELSIGYRIGLSSYLTPQDTGDFDRTGVTQALSAALALGTSSRWLAPILSLGYVSVNAHGGAIASQTTSLALSNHIQFWRGGLEAELSVEADSAIFPNFPSGRSDVSLRPAAALAYAASGNTGLLLNASLGRAVSSVAYFTQDRFTLAGGVIFAYR